MPLNLSLIFFLTNNNREIEDNLRDVNEYVYCVVPAVRIELLKGSPLYTLPKAWNEALKSSLLFNN